MINLNDIRVGDIIQDTRIKYSDEWRILSISDFKIYVECIKTPVSGFPNIRVGNTSSFYLDQDFEGYIIKPKKCGNFNSLYEKLL